MNTKFDLIRNNSHNPTVPTEWWDLSTLSQERKGPRAHDEAHRRAPWSPIASGGIQGPKDAMGDLPLQSYGAATGMLARHSRIHIRNFGFYPPKKYPFGAIKSHPPAPPTIDHQVAQDERRKQWPHHHLNQKIP